MKKIIFILFTVLFCCLILGCMNPGADNYDLPIKTPGIYDSASNNNSHYTVNKQSESTEIIVKAHISVSLSEIDSNIPGKRIRTITSFGSSNYLLYEVDDSIPADQIIRLIKSKSGIIDAELNNSYSICMVPNDTYYSTFQYAPQSSGCESAWDITTGSHTVLVAVIDTGINGQHTELANRVLAGYNFVSYTAIEAGANSDDNGHGSHCAGIIGAAGNNNSGIAGVAWNVRLLPVKVLSATGGGYTADIVAGIIWAVQNGAKVISMSLGGPSYSLAMADAVNYAIANNVTVIAAMGNDGMSKVNFPAFYPGVIAIGSINAKDELSTYSTKGNHLSLSAPGENIYSLSHIDNNGYLFLSGTSMSTPFVSGVAALLLSHDNTYTPQEIKSILEDSATDLGATGFDPAFGYGKVDVDNALNLSKRNNYGTIKVNVFNNAVPVSRVEVILQNDAGTVTLIAGLTSDGNGPGTVNGQLVFNYIHSGNYMVCVNYYDTYQFQNVSLTVGAIQTVDIHFSVATPPPDAYEPDNDSAFAKEIIVNAPAQNHSLGDASDVDWLWFTGLAGNTYTITAGGQDILDMYLYNSALTNVGYGWFGNPIVYNCIADGTYYIKIVSFSNREGDYTISVTQ